MGTLLTTAVTKAIEKTVEKGVEKAFDAVTDLASSEWEKIKVDLEIAFKEYERKSYDKYSKAKTILYGPEKKPLYDFFEVPRIETPSHEILKVNGINDILDIDNYIILKGTGGMGKSTLMQHLFLRTFDGDDYIPIFLELKELNIIKHDYDFFEVVLDKITNLGGKINEVGLEYALRAGCFVFLLDGYDEILSSRQPYFLKALSDFCDKYDENSYILSSRPTSDFIEFKRFTVLKCKKLTRSQAVSMIQKFRYDEEIKEKFINELNHRLFNTHRSFASNPLLLTIMLMTFTDYAEIPEKLHLFYAQAFETLFSKHDANKGGYIREVQSGLAKDDFKNVLSAFCFISYVSNKFEFTIEELDDCINKTHETCEVCFEGDKFEKDLINHVCILYRDGNSFKFTHRSFQEYFSALFLKELDDEKMSKVSMFMIHSDVNRATNDEVFRMLYDMCEERFEKNILLPLLKKLEEERGDEYPYDYYFRNFVKHISILYYNPFEDFSPEYDWDDYDLYNEDEISTELDCIIDDNNIEEGETGLKAAITFSVGEVREELFFIYNICYKYFKLSDLENDDEEAVSFLELKYDSYDLIQDGLSYKELIKDKETYDLIKKTWLGIVVTRLSMMYENIKKKNIESTDVLFDLLKI